MAISANISSAEVAASVTQRYVGQYFEAALINAPGVAYIPGSTNDGTFMAFEVATGTAGYSREVISYSSGDVSAYEDRGVGLATKATVFPHDGTATDIDFTHVALVWGLGNIVSLGAATAEPSVGTGGIYTGLPTQTDGGGSGLVIDLTINNNVFVYSVAKSGSGYSTSDVVTILASDLITAGAVGIDETANVTLPVDTISTGANGGQVVAVVQPTTSVVLSAGNEAVFYWNLKTFGAS